MSSLRLIDIDDTLRRIAAGADGDFLRAYGVAVGDNHAQITEVVSQTLELHRSSPRAPAWGGYLAADEALAVVIGTCGFVHGPEADGSVEIAYFTFPAFESRGYATAMARELLARALQSDAVREIVAHTLPERNASTRILEKIGLQRIAEALDRQAGKVWRWAYRPGSGDIRTAQRPDRWRQG